MAETVVENHEAGLLYVEGRLVERLAPGRHAYWTVNRKVEVKRVDLRPQAVEITAQEMLTKDRIALRVTLTALRRIVDPERAVSAVADVDGWLYRLVQFAIREAVAARTLDEVLSAKSALDEELRTFVRERLGETGIEVTELGVKDVILPGEIRELVNKVVEAERTAKANLIRRQEETAATRSLLNTAKLMEDNPLLLRLKELESLERLVEKVGRIDLHAGEGQGLDALLNKLVRLKADQCARVAEEGPRRILGGPSHPSSVATRCADLARGRRKAPIDFGKGELRSSALESEMITVRSGDHFGTRREIRTPSRTQTHALGLVLRQHQVGRAGCRDVEILRRLVAKIAGGGRRGKNLRDQDRRRCCGVLGTCPRASTTMSG